MWGSPFDRGLDGLKKGAVALVRLRQPVYGFRVEEGDTGLSVPVVLVGRRNRGDYFVDQFCGGRSEGRLEGHVLLIPPFRGLSHLRLERGLELVEISSFWARGFRKRGFITLPRWVEFGRKVVPDEDLRYADASKKLSREIRTIRQLGYEVVISTLAADFDLFYDRMFLPYVQNRFKDAVILKSRRTLWRQFKAGFLMLLRDREQQVAGGIVKIDGSTVSLTALGVLDGSPDLLRAHVSGAIDFHLHEWAAKTGKKFINVGHTRPFPKDGVFFNKRRWLMEISPDRDGTTHVAVRFCGPEPDAVQVLENSPFIYQSGSGLGVLCAHRMSRPLDSVEARILVKKYWTRGLSSLIAVCPGGFRDGVVEGVRDEWGPQVSMCENMKVAFQAYRT